MNIEIDIRTHAIISGLTNLLRVTALIKPHSEPCLQTLASK